MIKLFPLFTITLLLLAACGGGGGGGVAPTTSTKPANYASDKRAFEVFPEYQVKYSVVGTVSTAGKDRTDSHLHRINAAAAYARGATGAGETIAIVDTGVRDSHREFSGQGKISKVTDNKYTPTDRDKRHGTFVAALAAGNRDGGSGLNMHGVAFDASVRFKEIKISAPPSDNRYKPHRFGKFSIYA